MNQISSPSTPATVAETSAALSVLFDSGLPFQRGAKPETAALAYIEALRGMTLDAITAGIRKFLRGECEGVSMKFVPTPPELARIVRTAVVPSLIPRERRIAPFRHPDEAERARMRLKFPMFRYAFGSGLMDDLDRANRDGLEAMVMLAAKWGIPIPPELSDQTDADWRAARSRAWAEIERNPPPFMRGRRTFQEAAE